ncbi:MAG: magnesium transporter, partial [Vallitaleaceae bacterium]|nr:magnesium transporter [Vallitaleaceae bacterium]
MNNEFSQNELESLLIHGSRHEIDERIESVHPADLLEVLVNYEGNKLDILSKLPEALIANIIEEAEDDQKYELLSIFSDARQMDIVDEMASDELADLLGSIEPEDAEIFLHKMDPEDAEEVRELLSYAPDTAGGIMATEFISVKETMTVKEILKHLQKEAPEAETAYYIYVVDDFEKLKGVVSLRDIVTSTFKTTISEIMNDNIISVPVGMDQEEVGHYFEKYGFLTMPVVDAEEKLIGIVTVDDIMQILRSETTEDIYRLAGIQEDEKVTGTLRQ